MSTPITNIPTTVSYSVGASPSTGPFTIPFAFFSTSDITVYVGSYTALTLGTDYTVSGTMSGGGYPSGGTVTLTASVSSTWVVITRAVPIQRITQLPTSGKFDIDQLNQDLNVSYAIAQQLQTGVNNSIHIPVDDYATAPTTVLPKAASRANLGLKFDSSGNVTVTTSDPDTMVADSAASAVAAAASASTASTAATTATTQAGIATTQAGLAATAKTNAETAETNAETAQTAAEAARDLAQGYATAADVSKIEWQGAWLTATAYALNDAVSQGGSSYICIVAHTSGTFATDLAALKWEVLAAKGTDGVGSGDLLAANNLSDLASAATARTNLGLGTVATLAVDTDTTLAANSDTSIASQKATKTYVDTATASAGKPAFKNVLINGGMSINQRAAASNADDTYGFDRWNILTQTGAVAASQLTDVENTTPFMQRITQSQASAQRFGVSQIVESVNSKLYRGQAMALSARVRCSASTTLRYAILEWTGTSDAVTSDVVNDWTSGTFTAGNFFLAANLTVTATGATALTANTLTSITALTGTLGSSTNNLIVILWTDSTQAQNVTLDVGKVQLEAGSSASTFEALPFSATLSMCQRYYEKSYNQGVTPGTVTNAGAFKACVYSNSVANNFGYGQTHFATVKRTAPTLSFWGAGGTANCASNDAGTDLASGSATANYGGMSGFSTYNAGGAITTTLNSVMYHWTASAEL